MMAKRGLKDASSSCIRYNARNTFIEVYLSQIGNYEYSTQIIYSRELILLSANLALWNGPNPGNREVYGDGDDAGDPKNLAVVFAIVAEYDRKNDTAKIARGTYDA